MKNIFYLSMILFTSLFFTSCEKDDDHNTVVAPDTYMFERDGMSTVSFPGQTCRLQMAKDIYDAMNVENAATVSEFLTMFNDGSGFTYNYTCGTNVGEKTAASPTAFSTVKFQFEDMFTVLVDEVYPNWMSTASVGAAGQITTSSGSTYQVDGKGLEIDQAFIKGLMGAMVVDQMNNNYLTATKLDGDGTTNNTDGLGAGEYTSMEHYWDEGYGYLYGYNNEHVGGTDNNANGPAEGNGVLVNKYLKKLNEGSHPGIADVIYDAFKLGRAAIVAGDYTLRNAQAAIIQEHVDKIIAQKAIDYLTGGAETISSGAPREDSFHALSEGYGFVLSLQFTSYFTNSEVNTMLDAMMDGDGLWDISADDLSNMAADISAAAGL
ncbi:MAG: DUF4856 domain-containing protein [Flavobacteriales bacterium]|nr:DUF4856 domain-containing protein [Flavobacteriales bacterium]